MKSFPTYTMPPFIINQWELLFNSQLNYLSSSYSHISQGMPYISVLNSTAILKLAVVEKTGFRSNHWKRKEEGFSHLKGTRDNLFH